MKRIATFALAGALASITSISAVYADQDAFRTADTVRDIRSMGAKQMAGQSVQSILAGRTVESPEWTWTIRKNGKQSSKAKDGSWSDAGTWEVVGNQFCRESEGTNGKTICSDVYFLGKDLRFTEDANPKNLLDWYVSY